MQLSRPLAPRAPPHGGLGCLPRPAPSFTGRSPHEPDEWLPPLGGGLEGEPGSADGCVKWLTCFSLFFPLFYCRSLIGMKRMEGNR